MFVGGGTPSLVPPEALAAALAEIPIERDVEITVECNPDDVDDELLAGLAAGGVNRISLGVQSMVPRMLGLLGRHHDPDNVIGAVEAIRRVGFRSFNLDLIYGTASETLDEWQATLEAALALDPPHISAYGLTVEAEHRSPPTRQVSRRRRPGRRVRARRRPPRRAGLDNYEVSNWAIPGHECRHNLLYWGQHDYLGFGCAAHSHVAGHRWWNLRTPERYIAAVAADDDDGGGGGDARRRDPPDRGPAARAAHEGRRAAGALDIDELPGLVVPRGDRVVLTRRGRLMANEVAVRAASD